MEIIKIKNFISRIQQHLKDLHTMASLLNVLGFAPLFEHLAFDKAQELACIFNLGLTNQLKKISLDSLKQDFQKRIEPILTGPPKKEEKKSNITISVISCPIYPLFE